MHDLGTINLLQCVCLLTPLMLSDRGVDSRPSISAQAATMVVAFPSRVVPTPCSSRQLSFSAMPNCSRFVVFSRQTFHSTYLTHHFLCPVYGYAEPPGAGHGDEHPASSTPTSSCGIGSTEAGTAAAGSCSAAATAPFCRSWRWLGSAWFCPQQRCWRPHVQAPSPSADRNGLAAAWNAWPAAATAAAQH